MEYYGVRTACALKADLIYMRSKLYIGIGVGLNNGAFKLRINMFNISSAINANYSKTLFFFFK